ncbi:hypothetical protein FHW58_003403 [Duganella sp. 1224]|uniref:hypothetical protein n=1 Tax=Duganella sp. 1224 TaxID=2587052 RepID=UPI0015CBC7B8|nr:hypothetical protein [Duganella sp. 1224]NYE62188.1 hypothetical protein [Duganella sp. 1224]
MSSNKKYKIAVSNLVVVEVKGQLKNEQGEPVAFKFEFTAKRQSSSEVTANNGKPMKDILQDIITDVRGQKLVLLEDDTPAPFDPDMLGALLDISGMAVLCYSKYLAEQSVAEKN